jgi:hypothetical protein
MNPKLKSALVLGGTLLLGMVIGGLVTGAVIGKRAQRLALALGNEDRFVGATMNFIEPNPEKQDTVAHILHHYGATLASETKAYRKQQILILDSLKHDIMPLLTAEQQERFQKRFEQIERVIKRLWQGK